MPIDPSNPRERIDYMIQDSRTELLVTRRDIEVSNALNLRKIYVEEEHEASAETIDTQHFKTTDLAYIMYTSGSTGESKGTLINHLSIVRLVRNTNYITISEHDTVMQLSNYSFDGSVFDIFGALLNGAKLAIPHWSIARDAVMLSEYIQTQQISVLFLTTPALFNTLIDINVNVFSGLRKILFGGEKVSIEHVKKAFQTLGNDCLIHVYGPTENTVFSSYYNINEIDGNQETIPIGFPVSNTELYILDRYNNLVPKGVLGELCISGDGLARGYLNKSSLTAEKFVKHPFAPCKVMYKTGDMVKWNHKGEIEFVGRMDSHVKLRGFRIELQEIELQLQKFGSIVSAVVIVKEGNNGNRYLAAFVTSQKKIVPAEIRAYLASQLPDYMLPAFIEQIAYMPLTPNGKIDRKAVANIQIASMAQANAWVELNATEQIVSDIWSNLLGIKTVDIHTSFFDMGGDSLLLIKMKSELDKRIPDIVSVNEIFVHSTVSGLAAFIDQKRSERNTAVSVSFPEDYFVENQSAFSSDSQIDVEVNGQFLARIQGVSATLRVDVSDFLMGIYMLLCRRVSNEDIITVYKGDEFHAQGPAIQADFKEIDNMETIFRNINASGSLAGWPVKNGNSPCNDNGIHNEAVLYFTCHDTKNLPTTKPFILLYVEEGPDLIRICCRHDVRIASSKMEQFMSLYLKLVISYIEAYGGNCR